MTRSEMATIIGILKVAYPNYYKEKIDVINATELWFELFNDTNIKLVKLAVKTYISTNVSGFPPTIGQIKEQIYKLTNTTSRTAIEAWDEALKMISNGLYMTEEQFNEHSNDVKEFFVSVRQVRELAQVDSDTVNTVVKGQFLKQYDVLQERERQQQLVPAQVKTLVNSFVKGIEV